MVGSGSYGTVHRVQFHGKDCIGKRAWTSDELEQQNPDLSKDEIKDKSTRCRYYWNVEEHCFQKLEDYQGLPSYQGTYQDAKGRSWMVFELIAASNDDDKTPAPTLDKIMEQDRLDHRENRQHHLFCLSQALGVPENAKNSLAETLDIFFEQIFEILAYMHSKMICHRDVKPANLLVGSGQLFLIDFGSACDIDTAGLLKKNVGLSERVAISPIYAAPEIFVDANRNACCFDCFSAALLYCQLLFQYLDERTDAGFHQQLANVQWKLDDWLQTELQGTVRPSGLDDALEVLEMRPGLWKLLQDMLDPDPTERLTSEQVMKRWRNIKAGKVSADVDGLFLMEVLKSAQECPLPTPTTRALHFVATFRRSESLGLILAESDGDTDELDDEAKQTWERIREEALPGEVFVQGILEGGQADEMGIFEIGDRLQGVGELPIAKGGFEKVVEMLQDQPRSAKYVTLHFDRKAAVVSDRKDKLPIPALEGPVQVADQGARSNKGRRSSQEDTFILHEVHDTKERSIMLAGVADGHLGTAASKLVQEELPVLLTEELIRKTDAPAEALLESAWDQTCLAYRANCEMEGECVAEYDPREGILNANFGSDDVAAGCTAAIMALDKGTGHLAVLNCGDSRSILLNANGELVFQSEDHKPEKELERFKEGRKQGLDYSMPECQFSRWFVPVGDYNYALSRSLEGPFATSRGIVSTPDMTVLQPEPGMTAIVATDGLWDVMDPLQVSRIIRKLRKDRVSAGDAAKTLSSKALELGTKDNVSVVMVYLD